VIKVWLLLHLLGFTMWLGGGLASMVAGIATRREGRAELSGVIRAQTAVQKILIAPGALLTVLSGLILTFEVSARPGFVGFNAWLMVMQGAGILAALITLLVGLPTASRLGRLDPTGPHAGYVDELRQRQRIVASVSGTLGLLALVAGAMVR
jgi:hypothetical protein